MFYLAGGAGVRNYGDELIVRSWLDHYSSLVGPGGLSESFVDGGSASALREVATDHRSLIDCTSSLKDAARRHYNRNAKPDFSANVLAGLQVFENGVKNDLIDMTALSNLESAKVLHLHGGGYLNSYWPFHGFLVGALIAVKARNDAKLIGSGLGIGPLDALSEEQVSTLAEAFSSFDTFEVRDRESHDFVTNELGVRDVRLGLDDTFIAPIPTREVAGRAFHLSLFANELSEKIIEKISGNFISEFDSHWFWICTRKDVEVYSKLVQRFPQFRPLDYTNLVLDPIPVGSDGNYMHTMRFHPHLAALRLGMTGSFRSTSPYYDAKHGSIVHLGSDFTSVLAGDLSEHLREVGSARESGKVIDSQRVSEKRLAFAQDVFS